MKSNNWNKSEYVTFIGIALLSFVWRVRPSASPYESVWSLFLPLDRDTLHGSSSYISQLLRPSEGFLLHFTGPRGLEPADTYVMDRRA